VHDSKSERNNHTVLSTTEREYEAVAGCPNVGTRLHVSDTLRARTAHLLAFRVVAVTARTDLGQICADDNASERRRGWKRRRRDAADVNRTRYHVAKAAAVIKAVVS